MKVSPECVSWLILSLVAHIGAEDCNPVADIDGESLANGANDVLVVEQSDGTFKSTPFHVQVGKLATWKTFFKSRQGRLVDIEINGILAPVKMAILDSGAACFTRPDHPYTFTHDELSGFNLTQGGNLGVYRVASLDVAIRFIVYRYRRQDRFIVTDVDGTITASNVKGHVLPRLGFNADHDSVVELLDKVGQTGRQILYLTARPMAMDSDTREYLFQTLQYSEGQFSLPYGALFLNPKPSTEALLEAATRPEDQKILTLQHILSVFERGADVIDGAYGNTANDERAYLTAGIDAARVFTVNEAGQLTRASDRAVTSYQGQSDRIDSLYPPL
eukprot:maker-scaffold139_size317827-snap-gene-2.26 protein:Tk05019 transcript:maker-scaffold139_size317827-snap-gene-2.26-mRNA-1 annotation:"nuclear elongation and deformation protein 1-like"